MVRDLYTQTLRTQVKKNRKAARQLAKLGFEGRDLADQHRKQAQRALYELRKADR